MKSLDTLYRTDKQKFVKRITGYVKIPSIAEDIVQDAFLKAYVKKALYNPKRGTVKGWFIKILFSELWSYFRQNKRLPKTCNIDLVSETELGVYDDNTELLQCISDNTSKKQQWALYAHLVLGNSYKEVAGVTGETESSLRKIVQRFRERELRDGF